MRLFLILVILCSTLLGHHHVLGQSTLGPHTKILTVIEMSTTYPDIGLVKGAETTVWKVCSPTVSSVVASFRTASVTPSAVQASACSTVTTVNSWANSAVSFYAESEKPETDY